MTSSSSKATRSEGAPRHPFPDLDHARLGENLEVPVARVLSAVGVSPISFVEIQFLAEIGRLDVKNPDFTEAVLRDARFVVDEVPLLSLVRHSLAVTWARDPFDRLIAAHSAARRVPLCTTDRAIRDHHSPLVEELR